MTCPNCNSTISDESKFCEHCGKPTASCTQIQQPQKQKLILNFVYIIYMFVCVAYLSTVSGRITIYTICNIANPVNFISGLIFLVVLLSTMVVCLFSAILLLKRKKSGLILTIVYNIVQIVAGIIANIVGGCGIFAGITGTYSADALYAMLGVIAIIYGVYLIVTGSLVLIYYIKQRKHFK